MKPFVLALTLVAALLAGCSADTITGRGRKTAAWRRPTGAASTSGSAESPCQRSSVRGRR